jgi:four helix bundle protein
MDFIISYFFETAESSEVVREPQPGYSQEERIAFIEKMKARTKSLALAVIKLVESTDNSKSGRVVNYQLVKSATSVAANYRAACRARSKKEFFAKMSIAVEEADETLFWLEILSESVIPIDKNSVKELIPEALAICKILSTARKSTRSQ